MHKILILDDDKAMCNLLRACLSEGYEVFVFDTIDPEQALGLALEHKPDVILLDLMMPKFSGFELCQSFRSLSYTSTIPILVITGEIRRLVSRWSRRNPACVRGRRNGPTFCPTFATLLLANLGRQISGAELVLIETVGAAQMELGSINAQKAQRVYNAYRF